MSCSSRTLLAAVVVGLLLFAASPAAAQNRVQTARSFVPNPQVLAMGDAAVAVTSKETAFFYNPAHLTSVSLLRPRITILGFQASVSNTALRTGEILHDNLDPLFNEGFFDPTGGDVEDPSDRARQAMRLLGVYTDLVDLGEDGILGGGDLILPSVMFSAGPLAMGAGAFITNNAVFTSYDTGARVLQDLDDLGTAVRDSVEVVLRRELDLALDEANVAAPQMDLVGQGDAIALVSAAVDLGQFPSMPELSVGLTTKLTHRVLFFQNGRFPTIARAGIEYAQALCQRDCAIAQEVLEINCADALPLDPQTQEELTPRGAFSPEGIVGEDAEFFPLSGTAVSFDLGFQYEVPLPAVPGKVSAGLALLDILSSNFSYEYADWVPIGADLDEAEDPEGRAELEDELDAYAARARADYELSPQYRIGVAYQAPEVPGILNQVGVTMEMLFYDDPRFERDFANRFRLGVQGRLLSILSLRAGFVDRHPTFGAGVSLGVLHIEYALYAHESQVEAVRYNHTLRTVLRLF